jgi:hypothetical protein
MQWNQLYQGSGTSNVPYSLIETIDGGFAIAGLAGIYSLMKITVSIILATSG